MAFSDSDKEEIEERTRRNRETIGIDKAILHDSPADEFKGHSEWLYGGEKPRASTSNGRNYQGRTDK